MFQKEPALLIGGISSLVFAVGAALVAFGVDFSEDQQNAIAGAAAAAVTFIWIVAGFIRQSVYSPHSTQQLVDTAKEAGATNSPAPPVVP